MDFEVVKIENPKTYEIVVGQGNFSVKTVIDIFNEMKKVVPNAELGVAMNEAKPQLTRVEGNNEELMKLAGETCKKIGAGHVFVIFMNKAYPIAILNDLINVPGVVNIFVATSNPLEILVAKTDLGKAVIGAVDGLAASRVENEKEKKERLELLKKLGF